MRQHNWTVDLEETQVHFQLIDYGVQVFAWAGTGPNLQSLFVAVPGIGGFPAVTSLLEATPSNNDASTFCGRLSKLVNRPIALGWDVDGNTMLQATVEKSLAQGLKQWLAEAPQEP